MVRAFHLEENDERGNNSKILDLKQLESETGILYWQLNVQTYLEDGKLDKIRKDRGYAHSNVIDICPAGLPDYEEKVKNFHREHFHEEEEIHVALHGTACFDVRSKSDEWVRVEIVPGDMLVLPPRIYHRLTLIDNQRIHLFRLFKTDAPRGSTFRLSEPEEFIMETRQKFLASNPQDPANIAA